MATVIPQIRVGDWVKLTYEGEVRELDRNLSSPEWINIAHYRDFRLDLECLTSIEVQKPRVDLLPIGTVVRSGDGFYQKASANYWNRFGLQSRFYDSDIEAFPWKVQVDAE